MKYEAGYFGGGWQLAKKFIVNCCFLQIYFTDDLTMQQAFNSPAWYLCTMIVLWFISPILLRIFNAIKSKNDISFAITVVMMMFVLNAVLVQFRYEEWNMYQNPLFRIPDYCMGIVLGMDRCEKKDVSYNKTYVSIAQCLMVLSWLGIVAVHANFRSNFEGFFCMYMALPSALLVYLFSIDESIFLKVIRLKPVKWLADMELYYFLSHYTALHLVMPFMQMRGYNKYIITIVALIITMILAVIIERCSKAIWWLFRDKKADMT